MSEAHYRLTVFGSLLLVALAIVFCADSPTHANVISKEKTMAPSRITAAQLDALSFEKNEQLLSQQWLGRRDMIQHLLRELDKAKTDQARGTIAYLLGLCRAEQAAGPLAKHLAIKLPSRLKAKESILSERPVTSALIRIGKPVVPEMLNVLKESDHSGIRAEAVKVIRFVEGKEISVFVLELAIRKETDQRQKQRLESALQGLHALIERQKPRMETP